MGKKSSGKTYTSKGQHSNVSRGTLTAMKRSVDGGTREMNKLEAYLKGKNPWITIRNKDKTQTNRLFIRVRANDHYGNPKTRGMGVSQKEAQQ